MAFQISYSIDFTRAEFKALVAKNKKMFAGKWHKKPKIRNGYPNGSNSRDKVVLGYLRPFAIWLQAENQRTEFRSSNHHAISSMNHFSRFEFLTISTQIRHQKLTQKLCNTTNNNNTENTNKTNKFAVTLCVGKYIYSVAALPCHVYCILFCSCFSSFCMFFVFCFACESHVNWVSPYVSYYIS